MRSTCAAASAAARDASALNAVRFAKSGLTLVSMSVASCSTRRATRSPATIAPTCTTAITSDRDGNDARAEPPPCRSRAPALPRSARLLEGFAAAFEGARRRSSRCALVDLAALVDRLVRLGLAFARLLAEVFPRLLARRRRKEQSDRGAGQRADEEGRADECRTSSCSCAIILLVPR